MGWKTWFLRMSGKIKSFHTIQMMSRYRIWYFSLIWTLRIRKEKRCIVLFCVTIRTLWQTKNAFSMHPRYGSSEDTKDFVSSETGVTISWLQTRHLEYKNGIWDFKCWIWDSIFGISDSNEFGGFDDFWKPSRGSIGPIFYTFVYLTRRTKVKSMGPICPQEVC